jgi:hypothetical protein
LSNSLQILTASVHHEAVASLHAEWMPQKDGCCGPFWGAIAVRAVAKPLVLQDLDPDSMAVHARTSLDRGDPYESLPPGARPRTDYRLELPFAEEPHLSGTSARALADGMAKLAQGAADVLPVAGPWTAHSVRILMEASTRAAPQCVLIANWATKHLWSSRPPAQVVLGYLMGAEVERSASEWDVGHFVNLAGLVVGQDRAMVVVRDSYRVLGWDGYHLQPLEAVADALNRDDGKEGGVLVAVNPEASQTLRAALMDAEFELHHWDNGTPYEQDAPGLQSQ